MAERHQQLANNTCRETVLLPSVIPGCRQAVTRHRDVKVPREIIRLPPRVPCRRPTVPALWYDHVGDCPFQLAANAPVDTGSSSFTGTASVRPPP